MTIAPPRSASRAPAVVARAARALDPRSVSGYVVRRVLQALLVVWAAFTVTFVILYLLPGDPVSVLIGTETYIPEEQIQELRVYYGLDRPVIVQYLLQLGNLLRGNLGYSIQNGAPVLDSILEVLPETLKLSLVALILAIALAAGIAILSVGTRHRWLRSLLLALPPLGVSLPTFWVGLLLIQLLSFQFPVFPAVGNMGFASLVLPALTLAIPTSAGLAKVFAQSLEDAWAEPYIDTARAKGVSWNRRLIVHAARNALLPVVTLLAITIASLLAGSVVTETVFSRTGIGRLTELAVTSQDTPVVQGLVLLTAAIFAITNLAVDLLYPLLDPRVVLHRTSEGGDA